MAEERQILQSAASVFWMVKELRAKSRFRYDEWCLEFNQDRPSRGLRDNRRFSYHLNFLKNQVLPDLWGDEVELRSEKNDGEYVLYRAGEYW